LIKPIPPESLSSLPAGGEGVITVTYGLIGKREENQEGLAAPIDSQRRQPGRTGKAEEKGKEIPRLGDGGIQLDLPPRVSEIRGGRGRNSIHNAKKDELEGLGPRFENKI